MVAHSLDCPTLTHGVAHLSQTIEDCTALAIGSTWATGYGGGGTMQDCKGANLVNCSILRCHANSYGGLEVREALLKMVGGIVASCSSGMEGGGLTASAGATLVLDDLLVSDCESRSDWSKAGVLAAGGGIWLTSNGIVQMTGGAIRDCRAPTAYGGGLRCDGTSVVELRDVKVQGCKAFKGAAISIAEAGDSGGPEVSLFDVDIEDCVSNNNVIISSFRLVAERVRVVRSGPGAAAHLYPGSSGTWTDCIFSDGTWDKDQTDADGSAIRVLDGTHTFTRTAVLRSSGEYAGPNPHPHPHPVRTLPLPYPISLDPYP